MLMKDHIALNRRREARRNRAERVLRQIRLRIFDYEDAGKLDKANRVMKVCKRILEPRWRARRAAVEDRKLQNTPSYFE